MKQFTLKGFPTEISDYIEIPDIAELLSYPMFFDMNIDDVYKYGTEFQRTLLSKTPIRGNKNTISVLCEIKLIDGFHRSCSGNSQSILDNGDLEWHIDCEEKEDGLYVYHEERDIVHLFTSKTTNMTQFNKEDILLNWDYSKSYNEFSAFISNNIKQLGIKAQTMPSNRIVTFENHLHRATPSEKLEFRFMYRVVETDRKRKPSNYVENRSSNIINSSGTSVPSVISKKDSISIFVPSTIKPYLSEDLPTEKKNPKNSVSVGVIGANKLKKINIDEVFWEASGLDYDSELRKIINSNSIVFVSKGDYSDSEKNKQLVDFLDNVDKHVTLVSSSREEIKVYLTNHFFNIDPYLGPIAGSFGKVNGEDMHKIKVNEKYDIVFNTSAEYSYVISDDIKFSK